jgi:hypothetical protein
MLVDQVPRPLIDSSRPAVLEWCHEPAPDVHDDYDDPPRRPIGARPVARLQT